VPTQLQRLLAWPTAVAWLRTFRVIFIGGGPVWPALAEAAAQGLALETFQQPLTQVDRAITDGATEGFVKIHVQRGTDRIMGATVVARNAGDLISEISVAMAGGVGLGRLAGVIHPYPTQAEAIRKCGDLYNRTRLTPTVKTWFGRWLRWRRGGE